MIIVVRRVLSASVEVDNKLVSSIDRGLLLYVGIGIDDTENSGEYFAKKIANLRIFESESGEVSVKDISGQILSVSQFTLLADTKKGNRPAYSKAMRSSEAEQLFDFFNRYLNQETGFEIKTGKFGADMKISAIDDGPFTIILS